MRNVLLLAYYYPPLVYSSARRTGCMAKYLPQHGWQPFVVTKAWTQRDGLCDPDFVKALPADVVFARISDDESEGVPTFLGKMQTRARLLMHGAKYPPQWSRRTKGVLPDLFRQFRIDAVWASVAPQSSLWLADYCCRRFGTPWVADFRDVLGQHGFQGLRCLLLRYRLLLSENRLLSSASKITTVSQGLAEILGARHNRNIEVIENGFDPDDLAAGSDVRPPQFSIVYTGNVSRPRLLLDALSNLLESGQVCEDDLSVEFYGESERQSVRLLTAYEHSRIVTVHDTVPAARCADICRRSAVLFQSGWPGRKGLLTGKIFEYLAAQRPILCAPADGDCIDALLRETGAGVSCSTVDETARQLLKWYGEWKATGTIKYHGNRDAIMKYSRERQAGQLAELLSRVVADGARPGAR